MGKVKKITMMLVGAFAAFAMSGGLVLGGNYDWAGVSVVDRNYDWAGVSVLERNYDWAGASTTDRNYDWAAPGADDAGSVVGSLTLG